MEGVGGAAPWSEGKGGGSVIPKPVVTQTRDRCRHGLERRAQESARSRLCCVSPDRGAPAEGLRTRWCWAWGRAGAQCSPGSVRLALTLELHARVPFLADGCEPRAAFSGLEAAGSGAWALPLAVPRRPCSLPSCLPPIPAGDRWSPQVSAQSQLDAGDRPQFPYLLGPSISRVG